MNFLFLYNAIIYGYKHPDKVKVKILYYPLEETQEAITARFICFLLYTLSKGKIRISSKDLRSTKSDKLLPSYIIDEIEKQEYQEILSFFEEHVQFLPDRNATGIYKQARLYAENNGTTYYKKIEIKNKNGEIVDTRQGFDYYVPNNPDEYVLIIVDHISLIEPERGMDLRESINKLSEYMVLLRNRYKYIPVIVQQQSTESTGLDALKMNRIRPTISGLADSKYTGRDLTLMLGMTNPYAHDLQSYCGYDISKLKGNVRFLEVVVNREGQSNGLIALYFDGACNYFMECPQPNDAEGMRKIYELIRNRDNGIPDAL